MNHHPRRRDDMYTAPDHIQLQRIRKSTLTLQHYRELVRANAAARQHGAPPAHTALATQNARKHGLAAESLAVEDEQNEAFDELLEQLRVEYQPTGPTEELLVRDLWRHACFLRLCARAESGHFRLVFSRRLAEAENDDNELHNADVSLGEVACSERADLIARYRRTHERAFLEVQRRLMELRTWREAKARSDPPVLPATAVAAVDAEARDTLLQRFSREQDCVDYLLRHRKRNRGPACPQCRKKVMRYQDGRRLWRCARCGEQMTILWGTLMTRSRLPLTAWFGAIVYLMFEPDIPAVELQKHLDLPRKATAGILRGRILRRLPHMGTPDERLKTCLFIK